MTKEQILESSKVIAKYIDDNKLSKDDAMKPEHLKAIKKLFKQNDEKTKKAIEAVFADKEKNGDEKNESADKKEEEKNTKKDGSLTPEQKEEAKEAIEDVDLDMSSVDAARKQAEASPIQGYSLSRKMYFVHAGAKKKAEEAVKKYLQKAKAGEVTIKITNSAVDSSKHSYDLEAKKFIVGIHILLDKTTVAGLRKLAAVLGESKQIDEGLIAGLKSMFGRVTQAVKDGAKDVAAEAQKKIDAANEKMKELIGVLAIRGYITHFVGKKVADEIDANNVFAGVNESGDFKGRISYYTAVSVAE